MDFFTGLDVAIPVDFQGIPEQGTARYTLLNEVGLPMPGRSNVEIQTSPSSRRALIIIPASVNELGGARFLRRTLIVSFLRQGAPITLRIGYRVIPYLNHQVSPDTVRGVLGVNEGELPDNDVDVLLAYLQLEGQLTRERLETALAADDLTSFKANRAIALTAATTVLPSIRLRIARRESDGLKTFERNEIKDLDHLETSLHNELNGLISDISGRPQTVASNFILLTTNPDPITGGA